MTDFEYEVNMKVAKAEQEYKNSLAENLTKRELIAAMCLQGIISDPSRSGDEKSYAEMAIRYADGLLNQLNSTT